jgi:H+/Cl- antiporter ClcA
MTDNHAMVVPLMAASLIAYGTSRLVCEEGIYHALAKGFVRRGLAGQSKPIAPAVELEDREVDADDRD